MKKKTQQDQKEGQRNSLVRTHTLSAVTHNQEGYHSLRVFPLRSTGSESYFRIPRPGDLHWEAPTRHGFKNRQGLCPEGLKGCGKSSLPLKGSLTDLHQVSGQRQELAKYLGHTRESHRLILGCVPEGQGSGGTFFGDESTGRHHFPFTLLPSCWPSAGGCHFLSL